VKTSPKVVHKYRPDLFSRFKKLTLNSNTDEHYINLFLLDNNDFR